jgi:hypothetical protein
MMGMDRIYIVNCGIDLIQLGVHGSVAHTKLSKALFTGSLYGKIEHLMSA